MAKTQIILLRWNLFDKIIHLCELISEWNCEKYCRQKNRKIMAIIMQMWYIWQNDSQRRVRAAFCSLYVYKTNFHVANSQINRTRRIIIAQDISYDLLFTFSQVSRHLFTFPKAIVIYTSLCPWFSIVCFHWKRNDCVATKQRELKCLAQWLLFSRNRQ